MQSNSPGMYNQDTDEIFDFASFKQHYKQVLDLQNEDHSEWSSAEGIDFVYLFVPDETNSPTLSDGVQSPTTVARHSILIDKWLNVKIESNDEDVDVSLAEGEHLTSYSQLLTIMYVLTEPLSYEEGYTNGEEWLESDATPSETIATAQDTALQTEPPVGASDAEKRSKRFQCSYCPKTFTRPVRRREHENVHTGRKPYECTICTRAFSASSVLFAHRQLHHGVQNHACPECGKKFNRMRNMKLHHRLVHLRQKPYACPICQRPYTDYTCFKRHIQRHSEDGTVALAKKRAPVSSVRKAPEEVKMRKPPSHPRQPRLAPAKPPPQGVRRKRNTLPKRHPCELCGLLFARRRNVEYHVKYTHTGNKPHECEFCGKKYSDITSFKRHIRAHTEVTLLQQSTGGEEPMCQRKELTELADPDLPQNTIITSYVILNSMN